MGWFSANLKGYGTNLDTTLIVFSVEISGCANAEHSIFIIPYLSPGDIFLLPRLRIHCKDKIWLHGGH